MNTLILATSSKGKIVELSSLLAPIQCIAQHQLDIMDAEETGLSFIENALIKARHASQHSNYPALADDSGLVIDALQGQPGIYSSRYSGLQATDTANIQKVLENLCGVESTQRQAYFYCAIVLMRYANDPTPLLATGRLDGYIALTPQGANGFGYDPIFFLPQYQCTLAQLSCEEKNKISHRAKALDVLKSLIEKETHIQAPSDRKNI